MVIQLIRAELRSKKPRRGCEQPRHQELPAATTAVAGVPLPRARASRRNKDLDVLASRNRAMEEGAGSTEEAPMQGSEMERAAFTVHPSLRPWPGRHWAKLRQYPGARTPTGVCREEQGGAKVVSEDCHILSTQALPTTAPCQKRSPFSPSVARGLWGHLPSLSLSGKDFSAPSYPAAKVATSFSGSKRGIPEHVDSHHMIKHGVISL